MKAVLKSSIHAEIFLREKLTRVICHRGETSNLGNFSGKGRVFQGEFTLPLTDVWILFSSELESLYIYCVSKLSSGCFMNHGTVLTCFCAS